MSEILNRPFQEEKARKLKKLVWVLTFVVLGLVVAMRSPSKIPVSDEVAGVIANLPSVIALINTLVAACLLAGLWAVLRKNYRAHQSFMTAALVLSSIFLVCYVAYHFTTVETRFGDVNGNKEIEKSEAEEVGGTLYVYYAILIGHIVAAAVSFPMILMTFVHSWTGNFEAHKHLARKTFPLWLFVAVTGPVCYWMLKPYYAA